MLYNAIEDQRFVTGDLPDELYRSRRRPEAKEAIVRAVRQSVGLLGVRISYVLANRLRELEMPLLLVWGDEDWILPGSHGYPATEAKPGTRSAPFKR